MLPHRWAAKIGGPLTQNLLAYQLSNLSPARRAERSGPGSVEEARVISTSNYLSLPVTVKPGYTGHKKFV